MGSGIALTFLLANLPVTLVDTSEEALNRGLGNIHKTLDQNIANKRLDPETGAQARRLLTPTLKFDDLSDVDLVVEAAYETMEVKREIFTRLDAIAKPGAILATNTSYLDVDEIAAVTRRPADVLGLHFFSPANVMKLVEIVRGAKTGDDTLVTALSLTKRIGKVAAVAGVAYGFIGNRMLHVRRRFAEALILGGIDPYRIDTVLERFGMPMGPFRMYDLAGLDLGWSPGTSRGATIQERLCEIGRRGQKTGAGYYDYDEARRPRPSEIVRSLIRDFVVEKATQPVELSDEEILERLLYPMINEGYRILDEGKAFRASDIDIVWINGYGWPAYTGGPMYYAEKVGPRRLVGSLTAMGAGASIADGLRKKVASTT
jgi:3-hydroxyacyl-CoA dehydrogenase